MVRFEVVESKIWKNIKTGQTASIYGACPYTNEAYKKNWEIRTIGYTIKDNKTNRVGYGQPPMKTKQEAQTLADKWNSR